MARPERVSVFTRESIRRLDRLAVEEFGIPSILLMENAAIGVAAAALKMVRRGARIAIYCGPGNNGGDGLAAARHLVNAGAEVEIVLSGPGRKYSGDAVVNYRIARAMGIPVRASASARPALIIDALLGTGLDRAVEGTIKRLIARINSRPRGVRVLAVDIPSGLDANTGEPLGDAVRADATVTLVGLKVGFLNPQARPYIGKVQVAGIGAPSELVRRLGRARISETLREPGRVRPRKGR
jgi:NAD(P)H-hydrate epimerase